jgi:orotate phosphoribosyltransferase
MQKMNRIELAKAIYERAYIRGEFLLRSGKISNEYFDKYQFEADPTLLNAIAEQMAAIVDDDFDYLGALEMGGIPIETALAMKLNKKIVFVRKHAKEYGTSKLAEGPGIEGKKILIIEDVVTSGGQIILSVDELRSRGAIIDTALCVIDRESGGTETLSENGIQLKPLFTMSYIKAQIQD